VIDSLGKDPRKIFAHELNRNGIDFYANIHTDGSQNVNKNLNSFKQLENKSSDDDKNSYNEKLNNESYNSNRLIMRFSSLENNENKLINKNNLNSNINAAKAEKTALTKSSPEQSLNSDLINFETILKMESGTTVSSKLLPEVSNDSDKLWLNKFDRLYFERRKRIQLKKEIIINKIYSHIPILGEILAVVNYKIKNPYGLEINESF
jgi:hypothetical protein